ncbi:MAG: DUF4249 domain-containing protein, partial [Flammeovirgaceae bacterium]
IFWLALVGLTLAACETVINPELKTAEPLLVVDAWVTNKPGSQTIVLSQSQAYFDNTLPPPVSSATVTVVENGNKTYTFTEETSRKGYYTWRPTGAEVFGAVGNSYKLTIQVNGEVYEASSKMGPVPPVDSIVYKKNEPDQSNPDFYRAQFYAKDVIGRGDTYWIKTYKNGILLNKPSELNVAYDAGFDAGGPFYSRYATENGRIVKAKDGSDSIIWATFIPPIRNRMNPNDTDANDKALSPYVPGDSAYVEIHSITLAGFTYLRQLGEQTNRPGGFAELFSRPLANISTNISNKNPNGKKALGFFNVAAVSGKGKKFVQ